MNKLSWAILILALMSFSASASSQEEFEKEHLSKNFSGWKGIIFICYFDPDDKTLDKICQRAISDIELLAAAYKVNLETIKNNAYSATAISGLNDYVVLEYKLLATKTSAEYDTKAIHARLSFTTYYARAVEKNSKSGTLDSMPRSGDLELWSQPLIASGGAAALVSFFSDHAETYIKSAMTVFLKYAK